MDLLIKGLKMPNSCEACACELGSYIPMCPDDPTLDKYLDDERLGRHPSCPLIEIVRCKDCLYFYDETNMCGLFGSWTNADGFCHKAEKKEK